MKLRSANRMGDNVDATATGALPKVTTHDPGALQVLSLLKSPELKAATTALATALLHSSLDRPKVLQALQNLLTQTRTIGGQIGSVHCSTRNGRAGQQLAIHSLRQAEQAGGYLHSGLVAADPAKIKADLTLAETVAKTSESAGLHAIELLSK